MLVEGNKAPDFTLNDKNGNAVSLKQFKGRRIVLYFYPKDNTPGCTKEACNFRDEISLFQGLNAEIIGISADSEASHQKFAGKFDLPFILLSDPDRKVIKEYGVWKEKNNFGIKALGIVRTTFVIDENGIIAKVFNKVKVEGHNQEVKKILEGM
jgi:peroxiredoxin Q/BCP